MKKLSFLFASLLILFSSQAQTDSTSAKRIKSLNVSVRTMDNKTIRGRLSSVNDSGIFMKSFNSQQSFSAENIKSFTLKRKNSVLKGALIGLGIGAVTGIVIGLASGNDPVMSYPDPSDDPYGVGTFFTGLNNAFAMTAGQKAVAAGLGLGATGAIVGTIVGALLKKKFIIGGKKEKFHDLQGAIMMKLLKK